MYFKMKNCSTGSQKLTETQQGNNHFGWWRFHKTEFPTQKTTQNLKSIINFLAMGRFELWTSWQRYWKRQSGAQNSISSWLFSFHFYLFLLCGFWSGRYLTNNQDPTSRNRNEKQSKSFPLSLLPGPSRILLDALDHSATWTPTII